MKLVLVYSPAPRQVREWVLDIAAGSKLAMALENSPIFNEFPELKPENLRAGVWGKQCDTDHVLQDGDRVEIYRKLRVDPKVARRERFNKQGSKGTGLFATSRPGAKAGY